MLVHHFVEAVARVEDLVQVVGLFSMVADLAVDHPAVVHEAPAVVRGLHAEIEAVPREVIELVHVNAVPEQALNSAGLCTLSLRRTMHNQGVQTHL